jgi:TonB family protein
MLSAARRAFLAATLLAGVGLAAARAADATANAPWKAHQTVPALFPPRMLQRGIKHGIALVRVSIVDTGKLADALLIGASEREFGEEAMRVVKLWRFDPARIDGQPVGVVGTISFRFEIEGTIAVDLRAGDRLPVLGQQPMIYRAVELSELDRVPTPTHVVPPVYPEEWSKRGINGSAMIEFYVDETGRVRLPVAAAATHDLLAGAAAAAVAEWQFTAPQRGGQPALVRIEQTFKFDPVAK